MCVCVCVKVPDDNNTNQTMNSLKNGIMTRIKMYFENGIKNLTKIMNCVKNCVNCVIKSLHRN